MGVRLEMRGSRHVNVKKGERTTVFQSLAKAR
jgi:hypothetical protein